MSARTSDVVFPAQGRAAAGGQWAGRAFRRIAQNPMGLLGLSLVALLVFTGLFADFLAPYDPIKILVQNRLADPTWAHPLGTDQLGRDVLSRVIKGSQIALTVGVATICIAMTIGLCLGLLAGYGPRWLDNILMLLFDCVYSFPVIVLALVVITLIGPSNATVMLVIVTVQSPIYSRLVRTATLSVKNSEFILAERAMGASQLRIGLRHILPNVIGPLLILGSMDIPVVFTLEAGLSFLGVGVRPPAPSWGRILNEGYNFIRETPWIVIGGGIPLILATLGFTFLGETLRDTFDPKLRRTI